MSIRINSGSQILNSLSSENIFIFMNCLTSPRLLARASPQGEGFLVKISAGIQNAHCSLNACSTFPEMPYDVFECDYFLYSSISFNNETLSKRFILTSTPIQLLNNRFETLNPCFKILNNLLCQNIGVGQIIKISQAIIL